MATNSNRKKYLKWTPRTCKLVIRIVHKYPQNLQLGFQIAAKRLSKLYGIDVAPSTVSAAYYQNKTLQSYRRIAVMSPIVCVVGNKVIDSGDLQKKKKQIIETPKTIQMLQSLYAYFKKS